jgi:hypothetical protein
MESEKLWFSLLDRFVQMQRQIKNELKLKKSNYNPKIARARLVWLCSLLTRCCVGVLVCVQS